MLDMAKEYPPSTADVNYINLLRRMLVSERDAMRDKYWQQGYLGRFFVYLMDRII